MVQQKPKADMNALLNAFEINFSKDFSEAPTSYSERDRLHKV